MNTKSQPEKALCTGCIIVPCCGQTNTGQITNQAAIELADEGFGSYYCTSLLATSPDVLERRLKGIKRIVAIDGCNMSCAKKIVVEAGLEVHHHVLVTDLGIDKKEGRRYSSEQVERVIKAAFNRC